MAGKEMLEWLGKHLPRPKVDEFVERFRGNTVPKSKPNATSIVHNAVVEKALAVYETEGRLSDEACERIGSEHGLSGTRVRKVWQEAKRRALRFSLQRSAHGP